MVQRYLNVKRLGNRIYVERNELERVLKEQIEKVKYGDIVQIVRDCENPYNSNNFIILTEKGKNLGNMPAHLCNVIAPLYDSGNLVFIRSAVSFVEPISKRSRHAKQAVLFVELRMNFRKN